MAVTPCRCARQYADRGYLSGGRPRQPSNTAFARPADSLLIRPTFVYPGFFVNATPRQLVDLAPWQQASTGIIMPHAIGDSMYLLVLLRNLLRRGDTLTLIGGITYPLRDWFPYARFVPDPLPGSTSDEGDRPLRHYDRLVEMFPRTIAGMLAGELAPGQPLLKLIDLPAFQQPVHILESMLAIGQSDFGLTGPMLTDNGICAPAHLTFRREPRRVIIHPVASNDFKAWDPHSFVKLANRLRQCGLQPCFVLPPADAARWRALAPGIEVAAFDDLADLAECIYESGWFIGNDSGIGHLASALGLPTLSLFPRKRLARRWRPGWGVNEVAVPLPLMVTGKLKERFWRQLLPVGRVLSAFDRVQARFAQSASNG